MQTLELMIGRRYRLHIVPSESQQRRFGDVPQDVEGKIQEHSNGSVFLAEDAEWKAGRYTLVFDQYVTEAVPLGD